MKDAPFQTIEWLGLRFDAPADWEIVRHSLSPEKGSLGLVDRRCERMELFWTRLEREPDLDRMLRDQQSRELGAEPGATFRELGAPRSWRGFWLSSPAGKALARAVRFDAASARLVEAVIVPAATDDRRLVPRVLESIAVKRAEESSRCRAFGLDVTAPPGYRLTHATVKPADVALEFRGQKPGRKEPGPEEVSIRRMGMAQAWYGDDPQKIVRREAPRVRFRAPAERPYHHHQAFSIEGDEPGERLGRLFGRGHGRRILIWSCPAENAVYRISTKSLERRPVLPDDFRVACCQGASRG
jgi:hypothetical protein